MPSDVFARQLCIHLDRIPEVINTEAISVERSMFLATHTPFTDIKVERSPQAMDRIDEETLLASLLAAAATNEHALMVIRGVPGAGKSHLVRWLNERYAAGRHGPEADDHSDVVLLIERANASLRGTLDQLIASKMFDDATNVEQAKRLQHAAIALSDAQLANLLLNNLQVGTLDETLPDGSEPPTRIHGHAHEFLLDVTVRRHLMRKEGPIDRICRFLSEGRDRGLGFDEVPEFTAADLHFPLELREEIARSGNAGARSLATHLSNREQMREQAARYFNALLPVAIQRATALTGEDLRAIFFDLRRRLHRQGRGLVLFIEDVTSFTGIDAALLDVLVTQHTGEGNRDLCRMTSVIGVTDSFYADRIPANIKDRVTHQIALSEGVSGASQVSTPEGVGRLAARYLNVLRMDAGEVERWADQGASPGTLPNVCERCRFRPTCHPAFGAEPVGAGQEGVDVGLYPFNQRALWTMFQGLDTNRVAPTPRSLLRSVVQYVLQSHAHGIAEGVFPPSPERLGNEFAPPLLLTPQQRRTIDDQAKGKARSVETLVRVWGDRTVNAAKTGSVVRVGDLPAAVYEAFGLPVIPGEGRTQSGPDTPREEPPGRDGGGGGVLPPGGGESEPPSELSAQQKRIEDWRQGGKLHGSNDYATLMSAFLEHAIEWDRHRVPAEIVKDRLRPGTIVFDDQAARNVRPDQLRFERSGDVADALQALLVLKAPFAAGDEAAVGGAVARLASWRRAEEERIARHVLQPSSTASAPMALPRAAIGVNLALAALRGAIPPNAFGDPPRLLAALIENRVPDRASEPTRDEWDAELAELKGRYREAWKTVHPTTWREIQPPALPMLLRTALNVSRGGGSASGSWFVDVATAFDELTALQAESWSLSPLGVDTRADWSPTWEQLAKAWQLLSVQLPGGVAEGHDLLAAAEARLDWAIGDADAAEVVTEIHETLEMLRRENEPHLLEKAPLLDGAQIRAAREFLREFDTAAGDMPRAAVLANRQPSFSEVLATIDGVAEFATFVESELEQAEAALQTGAADSDLAVMATHEVVEAYEGLLSRLDSVATVLPPEGPR